jgi:uncharacterized protein involved in response to NO
MFLKKIEKDPFKIFFPVGGLLAFAGVWPWVTQYFNHHSYPRDLHRLLMVDGFLLAFTAGFLMTAIPRFTGAHFARVTEVFGVLGFVILSALAALLGLKSTAFVCSVFALLGLFIFAIRRFQKKNTNPPYTFVFIGLGLGFWVLANFFLFLNAGGWLINPALTEISQDVFSNGAIMSLILGVGGRLIPGILGWQSIVSSQRERYEVKKSYLGTIPAIVWLLLTVFTFSFLLKPLVPYSVLLFARFAVTFYFAVSYWRLFKFPATRSFLTWSVWASCWCMTLGYLFPLLWPRFGVHVMHVLFVGGFSLLTLLVSTRVSLAHSSLGTEAEKTSSSIAVFSGLILLAMITRVSAVIWPKIYLDHLSFGAMTWLAGLMVWAIIIVKVTRADAQKVS